MSKNKDKKNAAAKGNAVTKDESFDYSNKLNKPKISEVEQLNKDKLELTLHLQRLQAEFENYQKRNAADTQRFAKLANKELIKHLLPILDNFQLAFQNKESKEFIKGMELIYSNFYSILEENGLKKIDTKGKFDPYKHEVLLTEESKEEPETILEELQPGFTLNGEIIRNAKVKIAKSKNKEVSEEELSEEETK